MQVQPYLFFDGRAEEAIRFYQDVLGAEVAMLMRVKDAPEPPPPGAMGPDPDEKVLHAALRIGESEVMISDGGCRGESEFRGFSLSLAAKDAAEADRLFAALGEGGQVQMPLGATFFSARFGMVADRFGVSWMVVAP
jgi:PhnB protein